MEEQSRIKHLDFQDDDSSIHNFAAYALLNKQKEGFILRQHKCAYKLEYKSLYYKKESYGDWVLIANWCFYDAYIKIRYKRAIWLRSLYAALFKRMNFVHVSFNKYCIEVLDTDGHFQSGRMFRLSPPGGLESAIAQMFILLHPTAESR